MKKVVLNSRASCSEAGSGEAGRWKERRRGRAVVVAGEVISADLGEREVEA